MAEAYIDEISGLCHDFMRDVITDSCAEDVRNALWDRHVVDTLSKRDEQARAELKQKITSYTDFPASENALYTEKVEERRRSRVHASFAAIAKIINWPSDSRPIDLDAKDVQRIWKYLDALNVLPSDPASARWFSCEQALDCLQAIYEIKRDAFIDDILSQVIDMHMVRGLDEVVSPVWVASLSDDQIQSLAGEPEEVQRVRQFHQDRLEKQKRAQRILKEVLGGGL